MSISEMLNTLIRLGYVSPRVDRGMVAPLGSYKDVPSITVYGNPVGSAMMTGIIDAKLEQHLKGNLPGASAR